MSISYRLIKKVNPTNPKGSKKYYAIADTTRVSFSTLCSEIADGCTLTSADVRAVLDRANYVLDLHLSEGAIVQFGELGNFRISLSSKGAETSDAFRASLIKGGRILFTPGSALKATTAALTFSKSDSPTASSTTSTASAASEE